MDERKLKTKRNRLHLGSKPLAIAALAVALAVLPNRTSIPPVIESDYCHQLLCVERMGNGLGLTSLQPVAPGQPWTWNYDFGFLTQWPAGYSLMIWSVRTLLGISTIDACRCIAVLACAAALVGWFAWMRRLVPQGVTGLLVSTLAAGSAVTVGFLVNPSTDVILVAVLPFLLLATHTAAGPDATTTPKGDAFPGESASNWVFMAIGLGAGLLLWIRYAAIFAPIALGLFLLIQTLRRQGGGWRPLASYALGVTLPIATLLLINRTYTAAGSLQSQMNLGHQTGFDLSLSTLGTAWWQFTNLGFYDHHAIAHWLLAIGPIVILTSAMLVTSTRRALTQLFRNPATLLSVVTVVTLITILAGVTALFGDKFDYVGLERYYRPIRPLYFVIAACPILLFRLRLVRLAIVAILLLGLFWTVNQQWARGYDKLVRQNTEVTPRGATATCFTPGAEPFLDWLAAGATPDLVIVSNFREFLALELGVAALPVPKDQTQLDGWLRKIETARGIEQAKVWFVMDPDNRWRSYWLPSLDEVVDTFALTVEIELPAGTSARVFAYRTPTSRNALAAMP
jgi:hypothetical protein